MALYVSAGRRRRTAIVVGVVGVVAGLVIGFAVGRGTAPTVDDRVEEARAAGSSFADALRTIPTEYEQMVEGAEGVNRDTQDLVDRVLAGRQAALDSAPWLTDAQTEDLRERLDAIHRAPGEDMSPPDMEKAVDWAVAEVEKVFGVR
jgi:hypothetical protein